ncbi:DUF4190 domain-containing protein [Bombilactobacillus bombi]|uniref:DUF4190 domain-containing protein n=1 Tax=Bombilactobacillus bombi TaxID=1303590 RepID=UPI0015E59C8B|nr:zinc-ribbon domain-containing protein [Bombilactobacillus bombi]MBA1434398.1 zinc-ribbon domain-containing protein [Bombilactobacillus bombi]
MQNNVVACPNCGNYVAANSSVCPYCGANLTNPNYGYNNPSNSPKPTNSYAPLQDNKSNSKTNSSKTPVLEPFSLIGILTGVLSLIAQFGGILGSGAIVFSALALNKHVQGKDKVLAITGIILGIVSLICFVLELIYLSHTFSSLIHLMNNLRSTVQQLINH